MDNHILLVICVTSLSISVVASEENARDEVKNAFGSFLDEAKQALGPSSTWDLDKVKNTFSPSVEEAKEALGPVSSLKERLSPLSSYIIDEAKQAVSPSTKSKASKHIDSITSWLSQNELGPTPSSSSKKEEEQEEEEEEASPQSPNKEDDGQNKDSDSFEEAQKELGPISSSDLDKDEQEEDASTPVSTVDEAKEKLGSQENKEEVFSDSPSNLDEAENELGPISFDDDLDKDEDASGPVSSSTYDEAKKALGSISSKAFDVAKEKLGKIRSLLSQNKEKVSSESPSISDQDTIDDLDKDEDASSPIPSLNEPEEVSPSNSNEGLDDDYKESLGPLASLLYENKVDDSPSILEEAQKELGPISSSDLDKEEEEDASGPVSSPASPSTFDEAKEALGSISSQASNVAKEKLGKIRSLLSEEISSDSPSILDEPPTSDDDDLNKDEDASSPIPSLDEPEEVSPSNSNEGLDDYKESLGPLASLLYENKVEDDDDSPSILDEAQKELGPISSSDLDKDEEEEDKSSPVPSSDSNEEKEALGSISSQPGKEKRGSIRSLLSQNKEENSSDSPSNSQEEVSPSSSSSGDLEKEDEEAVSPVSSSSSNEAKEDSIDDLDKDEEEAHKELGPISSFDLDKDKDKNEDEEETFSPNSPSTIDEAEGSEALDEIIRSLISEEISSVGPISSFDEEDSSLDEEKNSISSEALKRNFGQMKVKVEISSKSSIYPIYFDHDVALAIESLIKQGQSNSELAIEEAEKLLSDTTVASSEKGKCMKKCVNNYASCVDNLHKAMDDLRGRNVELLTDDVNAVEGDIFACQNCFLQNTQNQSPFKDLEEATIKAARECLNVLHHSS